MGNMNKRFVTAILITAFVLASCGTPQNGNNYIVPQQINEPKIADIAPVSEIQIERVNNCDGTNPTYNVSYKTIEAQKASFEVSVGAGGLVTGTPLPPVLEVQLEAKITAALAKDYGLTTEKNHDLTLENVQGTFLEHTITWKVTRVKGLIEVIYGDGIAQVGFEKIANVELYNRTSQPLDCNDNSASILPTTIVATLETHPPATQSAATPEPTIFSSAPLLSHKIKGIGTGIFEKATYSDGSAQFSQQELNSSHFEIQLINPDTTSNGCSTSWYTVNEVWFGGASKTTLYLNGTAIGELFQGVGKHGYMIPLSVNAGDELCVNPIPPGGFHMNLGADIYYHYDSFCYRGYC